MLGWVGKLVWAGLNMAADKAIVAVVKAFTWMVEKIEWMWNKLANSWAGEKLGLGTINIADEMKAVVRDMEYIAKESAKKFNEVLIE
jgi:hypothetical protein